MRLTRSILLGVALAASSLACNGSGSPALDGGPDSNEAGPCSSDGGNANSTGAVLVTLELKVRGSPGSALIPPFSPAVHDYYVRCASGGNSVTVSAKAAAGANVSLALETPAKPKGLMTPQGKTAADQAVTMSVMENQAVVATAIAGGASEEYWIRCVPHDMSPMQWAAQSGCERTPGYYLVGNEARPVGGVAYSMVLDTNGVPVWYYPISSTSGVYDVDQIVPGTISFMAWPMTPGFAFHQLEPPQTSIVAALGGWWFNPHEIRALGNGHFLMFTTSPQNGINLTGFNVPLEDGGVQHFGASSSILPCTILEVDSAGKVVWTWVGSDHLDPVKDNVFPELLEEAGFLYPDPYHCNSIDVDPTNGNLLVSARDEDSVFYVDRASGKILWKLGGTSYTKDGAEFIPLATPDAFRLQHDARLLPGWSPTCGGQITVFDDEWAQQSIPARGVVYDVTLNGKKPSGEACGKPGATVVWQYSGTKPASEMGSFRITSDGSRIIGWGHGGVTGLVFTEVDAQGKDLLDLHYTDGTDSYRAVKLPLSALDLTALRNNAGLIGP